VTSAAASSVDTSRPGIGSRRRKILAVDDDEGLLDMLALLLDREHLDLRTAYGGQAGLDVAMSWEPDLILLDLAMPDLDAAGFLASYRSLAAEPAPVVLLSGAMDGVRHAERLGVTMFLAKPFDLGTLLDMVDTYARAVPAPS
jgi:DNA-binding response OmpR family regulator